MSHTTQRHNHRDHPTEEVLERFVLNRSCDEELECVESHILACDPCISRLQALEVEVATTKLALRQLQSEQAQTAVLKQQRKWFSMPALSMAGALAAIVLGVYIVPQTLTRSASVTDVTLSAYRGSEGASIAGGHSLRLHLNAIDLAEGPVFVQVVSDRGAELWKGNSAVKHDNVDVTIPAISGGSRFLRLYRGSDQGELLREFAFQIK